MKPALLAAVLVTALVATGVAFLVMPPRHADAYLFRTPQAPNGIEFVLPICGSEWDNPAANGYDGCVVPTELPVE
jgi:hypothetical protein